MQNGEERRVKKGRKGEVGEDERWMVWSKRRTNVRRRRRRVGRCRRRRFLHGQTVRDGGWGISAPR